MRRPRISPIRLLGLAAAFLNPLVSPSQAQSRATASIADPAAFPLTPLSGKVEPAGPLSLASAIDLALSANPTLAAAARELQAMEGTVIQAGVRPNPELAAQVEDTQKSATRTTTLQINQTIELGGKGRSRACVRC